MSFTLAAILSFSILIAGFIALARFPRIAKIYYPFVYLIWAGCINETISYFLIINHNQTIINGVMYGIIESMMLLWFFRNIGVFNRKNWLFYCCIGLFIAIWVYESFFSKRFGSSFNNYFGIVYSLAIVLLSITAINSLLFSERDILRNPTFLICIGIVIFFTYKVLVEMFTLYGLRESRSFRMNVYVILMCINLVCNLIYALAILWMRKKQAFTLQF